jgi:hypothetical protein
MTDKKKTTKKKAAPRVRTPVKKKTPSKKKAIKKKTTKKPAARKPKKISDKDKIFINNWLGGPDHLIGNATACYRDLHPKAQQRSCETGAEKLMRKSEVQVYLQAKLKKVEEATDINAAYVLTKSVEYLEMCMGERDIPNDLVLIGEDGQRTVVKAHARQFNAAGVGKALDTIGKHEAVQAFKEKLELSGEVDLGTLMARRQKAVEEAAAKRSQK